jgi:hypothetical protein
MSQSSFIKLTLWGQDPLGYLSVSKDSLLKETAMSKKVNTSNNIKRQWLENNIVAIGADILRWYEANDDWDRDFRLDLYHDTRDKSRMIRGRFVEFVLKEYGVSYYGQNRTRPDWMVGEILDEIYDDQVEKFKNKFRSSHGGRSPDLQEYPTLLADGCAMLY